MAPRAKGSFRLGREKFARKFELPSLRYRHATFAWGMFSRVLLYRLTLEREAPDGTRTPVTDLERYTRTLRLRRDGTYAEPYRGVDETEAWFAALARHIAAESPPGHACRVALEWVGGVGPEQSAQWEFRAAPPP